MLFVCNLDNEHAPKTFMFAMPFLCDNMIGVGSNWFDCFVSSEKVFSYLRSYLDNQFHWLLVIFHMVHVG